MWKRTDHPLPFISKFIWRNGGSSLINLGSGELGHLHKDRPWELYIAGEIRRFRTKKEALDYAERG